MLHSLTKMSLFMGSLGVFAWGINVREKHPWGNKVWIAGLSTFLLYPFAIELILNTKASIYKGRLLKSHACREIFKGKFPICYHPSYNITFMGLEKIHPFDS